MIGIEEIIKMVSVPILSTNPVGEDSRYEPEFERVSSEIKKLENPIVVTGAEGPESQNQTRFAYEPVEWDIVIDNCCSLLRSKCKDLQLATWLTTALIETAGVQGLASGATGIKTLVSSHWEKLFPVRPRARAATLSKFTELTIRRFDPKQSSADLPTIRVASRDIPDLELAISTFDSLSDDLSDLLKGEHLGFNTLLTILKERLKAVNVEVAAQIEKDNQQSSITPQQPQQVAAADRPTDVSASSPVVTTSIVPAPVENRSYDFSIADQALDYFDDLKEIAHRYHMAAISSGSLEALPYRWIRIVYWSSSRLSPNATKVPHNAPSKDQVTALENLRASGEWLELFVACERSFRENWFWIDLQRYALDALEELGNDYSAISESIRLELKFFLRKQAFVTRLVTLDGVKIASPENTLWVDKMLAEKSGSDGPESASSIEHQASTDPKVLGALSLSRSLGVPEALEMTGDYLKAHSSMRERYLANSALCMFLLKKREFALAGALAEFLEHMIEKYRIDEWEPEVASLGLQAGIESYVALAKSRSAEKDSWNNRAQRLLSRLGVLDLKAASNLTQLVK